jgi:hypothetical protein
MSILTDIIGSLIVGGIVLLMVIGFRMNLCSTVENHIGNQGVQETLRSTTDLLEYDLRKIGYRVPKSVGAVKYIDDSTLVFYGDFDNSGAYDSIRYYYRSIKPQSAANPAVGSFYRVANNASPRVIDCGMTRFRIAWYDKDGNLKPAQPGDIRSLRVTLNLESDWPTDSSWTGSSWRRVYSGASWERTIKPKNLR